MKIIATPLKGHRAVEDFPIDAFLEGKTQAVLECAEWKDYVDGKPGPVKGTKVTVVVLEDKTVYPKAGKNGQPISNRYAQLSVKCPKMGLSLPIDSIVELVGPTSATVWGDRRDQLSITAEDVRPVATAGGKH